MKNQFARAVALYVGLYIVFYVLVIIANFYIVRWLYSELKFENLLEAFETLYDIIVYSYGMWVAILMIPPAIIYFRLRKGPKSVLKVSALISILVMALSDTCLVLLFLFG